MVEKWINSTDIIHIHAVTTKEWCDTLYLCYTKLRGYHTLTKSICYKFGIIKLAGDAMIIFIHYLMKLKAKQTNKQTKE